MFVKHKSKGSTPLILEKWHPSVGLMPREKEVEFETRLYIYARRCKINWSWFSDYWSCWYRSWDWYRFRCFNHRLREKSVS